MNDSIRKFGVAVAVIAVGAALFLWSWNTLAALFGLPVAEGRHAVAALLFFGMLRFAPGNYGHGPRRPGIRHDH